MSNLHTLRDFANTEQRMDYMQWTQLHLDRKIKSTKRYFNQDRPPSLIIEQKQKNLDTGETLTSKLYYPNNADLVKDTPFQVVVTGGKKTVVDFTLIGGFEREKQTEELQKMFGPKFWSPQPNGLSKNNIPDDFEENFEYTVKTDGQHCFPKLVNGTIFEAEFLQDEYYVFDVIQLEGKDVTDKDYGSRLDMLEELSAAKSLPKGFKLKQFEELGIKELPKTATQSEKQQNRIVYLKSMLEMANQMEKDGEIIDGIVFSSMNDKYLKTRHYKLKPKKYMTNDFLFELVQEEKKEEKKEEKQGGKKDKPTNGRAAGDVHYLLKTVGATGDYRQTNATEFKAVAGSYKSIFDFHIPYVVKGKFSHQMSLKKSDLKYLKTEFAKSHDLDQIVELFEKALEGKLDGMIVETTYDDDMKPYPLRLRDDKKLPNAFQTCLGNFENRMLCFENQEELAYFNVDTPDPKYDCYRKWGNLARRMMYTKYARMQEEHQKDKKHRVLLDFGSGRGVCTDLILADKYTTILCFEPDIDAQVIYYDRLREIQSQPKFRQKIPLTYLYSWDGIQMFKKYKINVFMSNYSMHYNLDSLQKFNVIKQMLFEQMAVDGVMYWLTMGGKEVFQLLKDQQGELKTDKWQLKEAYVQEGETIQETKLLDCGQKIQMQMPWISTNVMEEHLVNIDFVNKYLEDRFKFVEQIDLFKDVPSGCQKDDEVWMDLYKCYAWISRIIKDGGLVVYEEMEDDAPPIKRTITEAIVKPIELQDIPPHMFVRAQKVEKAEKVGKEEINITVADVVKSKIQTSSKAKKWQIKDEAEEK